jgi:hypothetical protein
MPTLLPGRVTLASIRYQARTRADRWPKGAPIDPQSPDFFAGDYITTPELDLMLNASNGELYELMVNQFSSYWFTDAFLIPTDGTNEKFDLPKNMLKFLSAEWVMSPVLVDGPGGANTVNTNNTNNVTLRRFNLQERNAYSYASMPPPMYGQGQCEYTVFGSKIWFKPLPNAGQIMQVLYVPVPVLLADSGSITMNNVAAGNTVTIEANGTSYTFTAIAHGGSPTSAQFVVGGSGSNTGDVGTAASLAAQLNASELGGLAGVLKAYNSATVLGGTQVQICLVNPAVITWSTSGSTLLLSPNQASDSTGTVITWSNTMTGYAGLEEYLVTDGAIKMMQKEESDVSVLLTQKQALIARYRGNYENRDAGTPKTATNVRRGLYGVGPYGPGGRG